MINELFGWYEETRRKLIINNNFNMGSLRNKFLDKVEIFNPNNNKFIII